MIRKVTMLICLVTVVLATSVNAEILFRNTFELYEGDFVLVQEWDTSYAVNGFIAPEPEQ